MNPGTDGDILADFADAEGTVWLIASHPDNAEALVAWLYQQNVQILGVRVRNHRRQKVHRGQSRRIW